MKVLIINSLFSPNVVGGAELSLQVLAEQLVGAGVEITVASLAPSRPLVSGRNNGVRTLYLPIVNVYWPFDGTTRNAPLRALWHVVDLYNPWMASALARCVDQERPDIIHTNNLAGFSIAAWAVAGHLGIPVLHTIRDYYMMCLRSTRYRRAGVCQATCTRCRVPALIRRSASRWVSGVVGNSKHVLNRHLEGGCFREAKFRGVVYSFANATGYADEPRDVRDALRFGYLGQIEPSKGIELVVDHFTRRPHGQWELWVAGRGKSEYVAALMCRSERPQIRWLGWVDSASFLSQIDVLVVPSLWEEPLPRVILEAYQHGVPVVSTDRGGIPEVVTDGVSGLIFDPQVTEQFGQVIGRLLDSPELLSRLRQGAQEKNRSFTPQRTVSGYLDAYSAVLKDEGSR